MLRKNNGSTRLNSLMKNGCHNIPIPESTQTTTISTTNSLKSMSYRKPKSRNPKYNKKKSFKNNHLRKISLEAQSLFSLVLQPKGDSMTPKKLKASNKKSISIIKV